MDKINDENKILNDSLNANLSNDYDEEEGEIRDDIQENLEIECLSEHIVDTNELNDINNVYIDNLLKEEEQVLKQSYKFKKNYFDDCIFTNFDSNAEITENLNDIDENDLIKFNYKNIKDRYEMRDMPTKIDSETDSSENESSTEEIDIPQLGSILDSILTSKNKKSNPQTEKTRKGRIVDKDAELEYLIPADLQDKLSNIVISEWDELELVGTVIQQIKDTQSITIQASKADPILDLGTVVFDEQKVMVGMIDNIFGTKKEPLYLVVCKNIDIWNNFHCDEKIFCAPKVKNAYFTAVETHEIPYEIDSDMAFSDDEKEREHRIKTGKLDVTHGQTNRKRKNKNQKKSHQRPQGDMKNPMGQRRSNFGPPRNHLVPARNPFGNVNMQPFAARPPYWNTLINPMMTSSAPRMGSYINYPPMQPFFNYPPPMTMPNNQFEQFPPQFGYNQSRR